MRVNEDGSLGHLYFGAALAVDRPLPHSEIGGFAGFSNRVGEPVAFEYPTTGGGDYRIPGLSVEHADGSTLLALVYADHRIVAGKPDRTDGGLPATYVEGDDEADTLVVTVADAVSGLAVDLSYTLFRDRPVVARSARIRNDGGTIVRLTAAMSATLDLPDARWDFVQLSGAWARENHVIAPPLRPGRMSVGSDRGSSSHHHNPFVALVRATTTEDAGEVYGYSLVYSGNFIAEAEVDSYDTTRVRIGISPATFTWTLEPGAVFQTPEAILVYSATGLGTMSDALHGLYRERLARGTWRDRPRPVLINNWEATYFGFDESKLVEIATSARDLGVELFVLDDGWFGQRDSDDSSLGDWFVDRRKLPNGLDGLASKVEALGLKFGLWIEPEMISERSRLFEEHPDWAVGVPGRPRTESRQQFVLDMSRPEIVDHLFGVLSDVLASAPDLVHQVGLQPDHHRAVQPRLAGGPSGRVLPSLRPRHVRPLRTSHGGVPGCPVRVVRRWRRPVRSRHARLRAAGLDERRHRRGRAPRDPMGHVHGLPAELDGGTRRSRPEPPDRPHHAASTRAPQSPSSASSATSSTRPCWTTRTGRPSRRRSPSTRSTAMSSSAVGSSGCAARSRRGTGRRGWRSTLLARVPSSAITRSSIDPCPPRTGSASVAWIRRAATASRAGQTRPIRSSATTSGSGAATS